MTPPYFKHETVVRAAIRRDLAVPVLTGTSRALLLLLISPCEDL